MIEPPSPLNRHGKVLLVGLEREGVSKWELRESLEELAELAHSAGAKVAGSITQHREQPTAPFYLGKGKAEQLAARCAVEGITSIVFDDELSPAQSRNLRQLTAARVIDRTQLILELFSRRARSREGRLQIELAQWHYLLPRLSGFWKHLSRQSGGIGTRGPGETQLELDRRRVQGRIARLERELRIVRRQRAVQRQGRRRHHWPVGAIVGYTNAGKSTFLNRMTGADVLAADRPFATLDPTTRQLLLPNRQKMLLTDTVGFIRKLPHPLIEAFTATLEEVREADLLIHLVDISHPRFPDQMAAVEAVLKALEAHGKQTVLVFNKIDRVADRDRIAGALAHFPHSGAISARTGEGIPELVGELEARLTAWRMHATFRIPMGEMGLVAEIHRAGHVLEIRYEAESIFIRAHIPPQLEGRLVPYAADSGGKE